jgi:hypothetical protein
MWTLELAAAEAARQGITPRRVTGETIRAVPQAEEQTVIDQTAGPVPDTIGASRG